VANSIAIFDYEFDSPLRAALVTHHAQRLSLLLSSLKLKRTKTQTITLAVTTIVAVAKLITEVVHFINKSEIHTKRSYKCSKKKITTKSQCIENAQSVIWCWFFFFFSYCFLFCNCCCYCCCFVYTHCIVGPSLILIVFVFTAFAVLQCFVHLPQRKASKLTKI